jgi:carbamoyltransferase
MVLLGLNAWHGDAAAAVFVDGRLVAAIEEERLRRVKHWAGLPTQAMRRCLELAGVSGDDVAGVVIGRDPRAHLWRKAWFGLRHLTHATRWLGRGRRTAATVSLRQSLRDALDVATPPPVHWVEHHRAHCASAFLCSPYDDAAVASLDGFGDFTSAASGMGRGARMRLDHRIFFPHSLGVLYSAVTQHLGFPHYGDEYKVMGLAPLGAPDFVPQLRRLVRLLPDGGFALDLTYFAHGDGAEVIGADADGRPTVAPLASAAMTALLGPPRAPDAPVEPRHAAIANSLQAVYEEAALHVVRALHRRTGGTRLCLAGGCAMNSVANGRIRRDTPFHELFVPAGAADAGTAVGAVLSHWHETLGHPRGFVLEHAAWGPAYGDVNVQALLTARGTTEPLRVETYGDDVTLCAAIASDIADGQVVGWFQGRSEWGARALGHRSILADPRRADMRDRINARIKRRESFRPFAPSVLEDARGAWFDDAPVDPFMQSVVPVRAEQRAKIPAVTHVDGSGRVQTVSERSNPLYRQLIAAFAERTGVPLVLNTSFNEQEPIVDTPEQALDCFLRTRMDVLAIGRTVVRRIPAAAP